MMGTIRTAHQDPDQPLPEAEHAWGVAITPQPLHEIQYFLSRQLAKLTHL